MMRATLITVALLAVLIMELRYPEVVEHYEEDAFTDSESSGAGPAAPNPGLDVRTSLSSVSDSEVDDLEHNKVLDNLFCQEEKVIILV